MKNLRFASILILFCCFAAFGQNGESSSCPKFEILSLDSIPVETEPLTYRAVVSREIENFDVVYEWSASSGEIIEGQGTLTVKVLQKGFTAALTVSLEVKGLPKNCVNVASEAMIVDREPEAILIEEILKPIAQIEKADSFENPAVLKENPYAQLYIIFRYKKNTPQKTITRAKQKLFSNLKNAGIEKEAITLVEGFVNTESMQFWLVPPGATPPKID